MKKLLIALVLGLLLVAAFATVASADNGPHGRFNGSTEACASCHRAHSAQSTEGYLLKTADIYGLCTSCHDGTGAVTNVVDGFYDTSVHAAKTIPATAQGDPGMGLFGGGFVNARMLTDYGNTATQDPTTNTGASINASTTAWAVLNAYDPNSAAPVSRPVTSAHQVGQTATVTGTVWGSGAYQTAATTSPFGAQTGFGLECTSCHNPHGASGKAGGSATGVPIPSYRLLNFTPEGSGGFQASTSVTGTGGTTVYWNLATIAGVSVPDPNVKWYTPNTELSMDPSVAAYSGRVGSGEAYSSIIAGLGDYGGRYYMYRRPALPFVALAFPGYSTTIYTTGKSCPTGGTPGNPPTAGTAAAGGVTLCGAATGQAFDNLAAQDVMGFWCATCHDRYLAPGGAAATPNVGTPTKGGSRDTNTNDPGYHFRHRSQGVNTCNPALVYPASGSCAPSVDPGVVPPSYDATAINPAYPGTGQYTCMSCHNAHGSAAQATALSVSATYAGSSALLKADNRAICLRCHGTSGINFFNSITTPSAIIVQP